MKNVMLIDDDDTVIFYMNRLLELSQRPYVLTNFCNGKRAFEYLRENIFREDCLPDVIFLDINMPIMNGWDFLKAFQLIRNSLVKAPSIYMLSSSNHVEEIQRAMKFDFVITYFTKPIKCQQLHEVLDS